MSQTTTADIIVMGAGPIGLFFTKSLANTSLRIILVDKAEKEALEAPAYDGREIALTHPSHKMMQEAGLFKYIPHDEVYPLKEAKVFNGSLDYALRFKTPKQKTRLGYMVSNHHIRRASWVALQGVDNVTVITGKCVKDAKTCAQEARVVLDDGSALIGRLLVVADSRIGQGRRLLGISADSHDFARTAIVFRIKHTLPNHHTASECFFYGKTLALLPLSPYLSNCVITIDNTQADALLADETILLDTVRSWLDGHLGALEMVDTVHSYPLLAVHARRFTTTRAALIGDSACGMHPVTAHGYNLGLQGANMLARLILNAHRLGYDFAQDHILDRYNRRHQANTRPLYHGTNAMVSVFTQDARVMRQVRDAILRISNHMPPIKRFIESKLTG